MFTIDTITVLRREVLRWLLFGHRYPEIYLGYILYKNYLSGFWFTLGKTEDYLRMSSSLNLITLVCWKTWRLSLINELKMNEILGCGELAHWAKMRTLVWTPRAPRQRQVACHTLVTPALTRQRLKDPETLWPACQANWFLCSFLRKTSCTCCLSILNLCPWAMVTHIWTPT